MGTRLHQLDINTFNSRLPGVPLPTAAERANFMKPDIEDTKLSKRAICIQLTQTIQSVLDTAGVDHELKALYTPYSKTRGDRLKPSDTVNHVGIYPTTVAAQRMTNPSKNLPKDNMAEDDPRRRGLGHWYCLSVLGEVKSLSSRLCTFYMNPGPHQPPQSDGDDDYSPACTPPSPATESEDETNTTPATSVSNSAPSPEGGVGDPPFINQTLRGQQALARLADHMFEFFAHQHRLFAYGFYVQWKWARLLYFDRAGGLVSEPFDWTQTTSPLHDFVWKVAHMTPEQLGYDPTAQLASQLELKLLRSKMVDDSFQSLPMEVQAYVLKGFLCKATEPTDATTTEPGDSAMIQSDKLPRAKPAVPLDEVPIYKLTVTTSDPSTDEAFPDAPVPSTMPAADAATTGERSFLVGRVHFMADSLIGRCTRGYIAFDLEDKVFCFLKDSWRSLVAGRSRPEHLVYERLRDRNVGDIASLVCGGDVGGHRAQVTHSQDSIPPGNKPVPRVHYRIVIEEIGIPLTEFEDFTELAAIFREALGAHMAAYKNAGILHHDISVGNILINPRTRTGFLIDWDVCRLTGELGNGPIEPDRIGTWQFQSALSLRYPRKPYRVADDIESFVHVFQYMVLRFHPTSIAGLRMHVHSYFEQSSIVRNVRLGGQNKLFCFKGMTESPFKVIGNPTLQALLDKIASKCHHGFYSLVDEKLMERKYGLSPGVPVGPRPTQARQEPAERLPPSATTKAMMARARARLRNTPGPSLPVVPQASPGPKIDACDLNGFLSRHYPLMVLFDEFCGIEHDKYEDQFIARAAEEPVPLPEPIPASSVSQVSWSQTQDDADHPASAAAPEPATTGPPLSSPVRDLGCASASALADGPCNTETSKKRKQRDVNAVEGAIANNGNGNNDSEGFSSSSPQQRPKRQRKTRS